ncbi:DEKNAAC104651 [Brettanomyces naardenensis]|uniref:2,4-dienoyl-CoA reductase [(3E)-enoyl-CoA-producing] n=1 Tax=Brettanomyces naardenensis TaxID=13370 RepID=A0A448YQX8_BRENA|nr:DEKNAAC104651 [Brettanomyces naardenensis]
MSESRRDQYLRTWHKDLFKGKVCLITGGSGTICSKQAEALVVLGCSISIIGREQNGVDKTVKELSEIRTDVRVVGFGGCDVRSFDSVQSAVKKTVDQLGRIDFLVCGAAGNFLADFNHMSSNAFKTVIDIDLLGSFNAVKACYEQLRQNRGSIIFISATLHYYGVPFQSHVSAAKAGIDALSNALAVELGPLGIRVNCIAPGPIGGTEGFQRLVPNKKGFASKIPLQRVGSVQDIANATIYLFSDASSFVTGTIQVVDGGFWQMGNFNTFDMYPEALRKRLLEKPKL